jgi:hypothetical protein
MPLDFLTADRIELDLRPAKWWASQGLVLRVENLQWLWHRAHEDEWSSPKRQAAYVRWKRATADWVCSLVEPPNGGQAWAPAWWQWAFDLFVAHLDIHITRMHLRVEDRAADVAFGIAIQDWHLSTCRPGAVSLGAPRRTFDMRLIHF